MKKTLALSAISVMLLTGCSAIPTGDDCQPDPLRLSVDTASLGESVSVSSAGFTSCRGGYQSGKTYNLTLRTDSGDRALGAAPVSTSGSFVYTFNVPDVSAGQARVEVTGSIFDDCSQDAQGNTVGSGACPGYGVPLTITGP